MLGRRLFLLFLVFGCCFEHFYTVRSTQYANILQKKKENRGAIEAVNIIVTFPLKEDMDCRK